MLEYLKLEINSYFTRYFVEITCNNGILNVKYGDFVGEPIFEKKLPAGKSQKTLKKIEDLHIEKWKSDYELPRKMRVLDGEAWKVDYKVAGKRCKHMSGYVEHPQNWTEFLFVLSEISPVDAPVQLEKFEFQYDYISPTVSVDFPSAWVKIQKCREKITVDAKKNLFSIVQTVGKNQEWRYELRDEDCIRGMLDDISFELSDLDDDDFKNPKNKEYSLKLEYLYGKKQHFYGSYNRVGLPEDWTAVMDVFEMSTYHPTDINHCFNFKTYGYGAKDGEYILCSVAFDKNPKTYYYLTDDESIRPNSKVLVPVGDAGELKKVTVKKVEYFTAENLPMPLENIKKIIKP